MAIQIVAPILGWLATAFGKKVLTSVAFFLALKLLLSTLFIIVLPIVLNNVIFGMMETATSYLSTHAPDSTVYNGLHQMSGIGAWLLDCLKVPDALAYLVACLQLHLILKMIPFSPVK